MTTADLRSERIRRQVRRKLLEQFVGVGRSAQRILDNTEISDAQREGLQMMRDGADKVRNALNDD